MKRANCGSELDTTEKNTATLNTKVEKSLYTRWIIVACLAIVVSHVATFINTFLNYKAPDVIIYRKNHNFTYVSNLSSTWMIIQEAVLQS